MISPPERNASKFSIDDKVRITKKKSIFDKGYTPRWTEEVFFSFRSSLHRSHNVQVKKILTVKGSFYEQELQKTTQEMFRIEKVIRRKEHKSLVKWLGYKDEFNSWVDNKDLVKL